MNYFLFFMLFAGLGSSGCIRHEVPSYNTSDGYRSLRLKAVEARQYCRQNNMDTDIALLIDMGMHSGLKRLAVWDFKLDSVLATGMVSHGCGKEDWAGDKSKSKVIFSNEKDSHCTSLGKYKIGERGYSQWGIHVKYLLHGLESTNSNALARTVVLHSWNAIPDMQVYPSGIPESWGCPAVSDHFMKRLDSILIERKRPVLLWIYRSDL